LELSQALKENGKTGSAAYKDLTKWITNSKDVVNQYTSATELLADSTYNLVKSTADSSPKITGAFNGVSTIGEFKNASEFVRIQLEAIDRYHLLSDEQKKALMREIAIEQGM